MLIIIFDLRIVNLTLFSYSCNWFSGFFLFDFRCKHDENQSGRKHVCELCGKGFFTPNSLKEHMFTHSDIKRFSCHICGKQLKNDSCYRRHMVCVHGQKYTCEICKKDFSALNGINLHKREVHGIMYWIKSVQYIQQSKDCKNWQHCSLFAKSNH